MQFKIKTTNTFEKWHREIKDKKMLTRIDIRVSRVSRGNFGDYKKIGNDLFELRLFFGGGYRIYYTIKSDTIVLLLTAGNKNSQQKDIKQAKTLLEQL